MAGKRSGRHRSGDPRRVSQARPTAGSPPGVTSDAGDAWLYQGKVASGVAQRIRSDGTLDPNEIPVVTLTASVARRWGAMPGDPDVTTFRLHLDPSQAKQYGAMLIRMAELLEIDPTGRTGRGEDPFIEAGE